MKKALITMGLLCMSFMSIAAPTPEQYQALAKAETLLRDDVNSSRAIPDEEKESYANNAMEKLRKTNSELLAKGYSCEQISGWINKAAVNNQNTKEIETYVLRLMKFQAASCSVQASSMD